jgi:hypothetical protein
MKPCRLGTELPKIVNAVKAKTQTFSVFKEVEVYDLATTCPGMRLTFTHVSKTPGVVYSAVGSPFKHIPANSMVNIIVSDKVHPDYKYFEIEMTIHLSS